MFKCISKRDYKNLVRKAKYRQLKYILLNENCILHGGESKRILEDLMIEHIENGIIEPLYLAEITLFNKQGI